MKKHLKIVLGVVASLAVIAVIAGVYMWNYINTPYNADKPQWIYLPAGTSRAALADSLKSALGEQTGERTFKIFCAAASDSAIIRGAYLIQPGTSAKNIARTLISRRQTPVRVTFNTVRTLPVLAERLDPQLDISASDFLDACRRVLPEAGFSAEEQYPAAFIPDTYEFYWDSSADNVVRKLLQVRNNFWNDERRAKAQSLGLNPVKVATLASIVADETKDFEERKIVARLYLNRLRINMPLQADPTVKFALGDFKLRRILKKHLTVDSPYNTYKHRGLPPGPISVPEKSVLLAVLDAPDHDYLYMCARPDRSGRHNFATTYSEHLANARKFQQWLNSRKIF